MGKLMITCPGGTGGVRPLTPRFGHHDQVEVKASASPHELSRGTFAPPRHTENGAEPHAEHTLQLHLGWLRVGVIAIETTPVLFEDRIDTISDAASDVLCFFTRGCLQSDKREVVAPDALLDITRSTAST